jgi:hypothetical protein
MKQKYYVNNESQFNGDHEVHIESCIYYLKIKSKTYLGEHESCKEAVRAAEKFRPQVNGCVHCCRACHTS